MHERVIRDFLNLPGIAGIALINERSSRDLQGELYPFFYSLDLAFECLQKESLSQGILQVLETIPNGFESFEFCFSTYHIQLHRLRSTLVLLVVARDVSDERYSIRLEGLKILICEDLDGTLTALHAFSVRCHSETLPQPNNNVDLFSPSCLLSSSAASFPSLGEVVTSLNDLCRFAREYLGTAVIVNYLRSSRPDVEWLQQFAIDRNAQIHFSGGVSTLERAITLEEQQWIQEWVALFIRRCSRPVRNFGALVEQTALSDTQRSLLRS
jgi:hypothetical protein